MSTATTFPTAHDAEPFIQSLMQGINLSKLDTPRWPSAPRASYGLNIQNPMKISADTVNYRGKLSSPPLKYYIIIFSFIGAPLHGQQGNCAARDPWSIFSQGGRRLGGGFYESGVKHFGQRSFLFNSLLDKNNT